MIMKPLRSPRALIAILAALMMAGTASAQIVPLPTLPTELDIDVPFAGVSDPYTQDFNADDGEWTAVTGVPPRTDWEWGAPTSGPGVAASGTNVWATNLEGAYINLECGALLSPPIDLGGASSASVAWKEWRHMEMGTTIAWDAGLLFVTDDDGATYTKVTPGGGYASPGLATTTRSCLQGQPTGTPGLSGPTGTTPPPAVYSDLSVDLSAFVGSTIRFAVAFGTDSVVTRDGWYLDDFATTIDGTTTVEDFEADDGGFAAVDWNPPGVVPKGWSWGVPLTGPTPGPGAFSMWATDLAGNHGNNECSSIESVPIDLTLATGTNVMLEWRQWYRANSGAGGVVQVGHDGTYTNLVPIGGYGSSNPSSAIDACLQHNTQQSGGFTGNIDVVGDGLRAYSADLSAWRGEEVTVRFLFAATATVTPQPGWYVDDVRLTAGVGGQNVHEDLPDVAGIGATGVFLAASTPYAEDFNFDEGGWSESGTGAWQWGDGISPPEQIPGSVAMWGTRLFSNYEADECSALTSVAIPLPAIDPGAGLTLSQLSFKMWRQMQNVNDGAVLEASIDGGANWTRVAPSTGYDGPLTSSSAAAARACLGVNTVDPVWTGPTSAPAPDEWENVTVDLTPFMGHDVQVRLVFASTATSHYRGVYIDNVVVQTGAGSGLGGLDLSTFCPAPAGWTVTGINPSWCWGRPTTGPTENRPVWATGLHQKHNKNECSAIEYGPIDTNAVAGLGVLTLQFTHHFKAGSTVGGGLVQVSDDDGATWTTVTPVGGYGANLGTTPRACLAPGATSQAGFTGTTMSGYEFREARIPGFQGDTINVRFAFGSSSSTPNDGWYVRGVQLSRGLAPVPFTAATLPVPPVPLLADLKAKADPVLLGSVLAGKSGIDMIVVGEAITGATEGDFGSREEAMREIDHMAAPFIGRVGDIAASYGGEVLGAWSAVPAVWVRGDEETALRLAEERQVRAMTEDFDGRVQLVDPIEDDGFHADNSEGRNMLEAEDVWALGYRGEGINIAVIDTGIDPTHEAHKNADGGSRVLKWANCITGTSPCNTSGPMIDDHGHGTHVAATAVGKAEYDDPTWGVFQEQGVAPNADLFVAKFLSGSGSGSFADGMKALQWAFDEGADITSNSWGSTCASGVVPTMALVRQLTDLGMLSVFAAGNSGPGSGTIGGPACSESALTIGAVDASYNAASFSSRGPCTDIEQGTPSRICPDLVAKGVAVRSAIPRSGATYGDPSGYRVWQGTSMATPHAAGAAALIEQMKRDLTGGGWDTVARAEEEVFKLTSLDLGAAGEDNTFGWGHPKLTVVYALLNDTDSANIVSTFGISQDVLHLGDTSTLSFSVRNLGGAPATGDFLMTLEDPDGEVTTLDSATVTLSLLDGRSVRHEFRVTGGVAPGTYTVNGSFVYSYPDPVTGEPIPGAVFHEGTFVVKRVFVEFDVQGLPAETLPLALQSVNVTATNTGNEDGSAVVIEFTVPDAYRFVPGANWVPTQALTQYADPAPDRVVVDEAFGRTTLIFEVGVLPEGESFSFTTQLLPVELGTHTFIAAAKFKDGAGNGFTMGVPLRQTVEVPLP